MANGVFAGGNGSLENPYLIEDAWDVNAIRNDILAHYKLIKDIDLNDVINSSDGSGWTPIPVFSGSLEGQGFSIRNLYINRPASTHQALFAGLSRGAIRNLGVVDFYINGGNYSAALAGTMVSVDCLVDGCFAEGTVTGGAFTGGLVSSIQRGTVSNSYTDCKVTASGANTGGISGLVQYASGTIKNCLAKGTVIAGSTNGSGLVGQIADDAQVVDSFFDSTVSGLTGTGSRTTVQLKAANTYANWATVSHDFKNKKWIIRDGYYPSLFYNESVKYLVFVDGAYKTFKNNTWVTVSTEFPSEDVFNKEGISSYQLPLTGKINWNKLKQYGSFDLVSSVDKYKVERSEVRLDMVQTDQISDAVILKARIDFASLGDSVNNIKLVQ